MGHVTNKRKQKLYASARSIEPVQDEPVQDELTERSRRKKK